MTSRRQRQKAKLPGICVACGGPSDQKPGSVDYFANCPRCRQMSRKAGTRLYADRKAKGLCVSCGGQPRIRTKDGKPGLLCVDCQRVHRTYGKQPQREKAKLQALRERIAERRAKGLCVRCSHPAMLRLDGKPAWNCKACLDLRVERIQPDRSRDDIFRAIAAKGGLSLLNPRWIA